MNRLASAGTPGHLLGMDSLGRDIVDALLAGAKNSVAVATGACGLNVMVGVVLGLTAVSLGRTTGELIM